MCLIKEDSSHIVANYLSKKHFASDRTVSFKKEDNRLYTLLHIKWQLYWADGIFECIMNDVQKVINQKFIKIGIYKEFLKEKFEISTVPCYYWLLCLIKLVKPESLNRCFIKWAEDMMPEKKGGLTIAMDGMVCGDNAPYAPT